MLMGDSRPDYRELVDRLVRTTSELEEARATLREYGQAEDDGSLGHLVAIWRAKALSEGQRANQYGTRCSLAERLVRQLLAGKQPHGRDVKAWIDATKETSDDQG